MVDDLEIEAIVASVAPTPTASWRLELLQVSSGTHAIPTATVRLRSPDGETRVAAAEGDGPVDAACRAVDQCMARSIGDLVEFHVDAAAEGINALGGVRIALRERPSHTLASRLTAHGFAVHTDIIVAAAEAYVAAINALSRAQVRRAASQEVAA